MRSFPWQNESVRRTVHGNEAAIKSWTWLSDQLAAVTHKHFDRAANFKLQAD